LVGLARSRMKNVRHFQPVVYPFAVQFHIPLQVFTKKCNVSFAGIKFRKQPVTGAELGT
jgi:hypothetical protein